MSPILSGVVLGRTTARKKKITHSFAVNNPDNYLLYSQMGSHGHYADLVLRGSQDKVQVTCESTDLDSCVLTCSSPRVKCEKQRVMTLTYPHRVKTGAECLWCCKNVCLLLPT